MPSSSQWVAFLVASILFIQVPGPSLLFTIGRALTVGRREALLSALAAEGIQARAISGFTVFPGVDAVDEMEGSAIFDPYAPALSQGDQALLVEPTASLLLWQAEQKKVELHRGQSLEQAWAEVFPSQQALPQAGVMANVTVAHDTELNQAVERAYAESARWCSQQPQECAQMVHGYLPQFPVPAIQTAIEKTRLDSRPASEIRPQLEALYQLLADQHPQALGGGLPAAGFYGP